MVRKYLWESTERIETLVDGIFAIAMTLLVLNLDIPQLVNPITDATLQNILFGLGPKLFTYALSFILLAIFWRVNHGQFYYIKRLNSPLLWITVIWLLFVALVPFSTSLVGQYGNLTTAQVFFGLNMFFIGILIALIWYYATEKNFTVDNLKLEQVMYIRRLNLILPIVSLIAIGLAFIIPSWSSLAYILIPILHRFMEKNSEKI